MKFMKIYQPKDKYNIKIRKIQIQRFHIACNVIHILNIECRTNEMNRDEKWGRACELIYDM